MHHFCNHYYTNYVKVSDPELCIITMSLANILIKNLLSDSDNLTNQTSLGMYMIFQHFDNNELQVDISKL